MITRVRMSSEQRQAEEAKLQEQRAERQAEEWATELNWIYANDNPTCRRALQLEALLDTYWDDKPDWDEEELLEIQNMQAA
jgi:hypothetical protein